MDAIPIFFDFVSKDALSPKSDPGHVLSATDLHEGVEEVCQVAPNPSGPKNEKDGCFPKWWYPRFTPLLMIIFSSRTHGCWGNPPF